LRRDFVDESVSIPRGELGDFSPVFIPALERPYFTLRNLDMPSGWLKRVLADLAQDRFSEGFRLTKQHGVEVKVSVIGTAILDPWRETESIGFRCLPLPHGGGYTPKVLVGGIPLDLMGTAPISLLCVGCDAERMLALTGLLSRGIFPLTFNLRSFRAFQRLVLRLHSIEERL
jgi:hypothetical protein